MIFVFAFLASCGSSNSGNSTQGAQSYKTVAAKALGENVEFTMNDAKAFVLCVKEVKGTPEQPRNSLSYAVVKVADNAIVLENKVDGGTVSWYNEQMIQLYITPGIMRDDQTRDDFITLYNVKTGKSFPKNKMETH